MMNDAELIADFEDAYADAMVREPGDRNIEEEAHSVALVKTVRKAIAEANAMREPRIPVEKGMPTLDAILIADLKHASRSMDAEIADLTGEARSYLLGRQHGLNRTVDFIKSMTEEAAL